MTRSSLRATHSVAVGADAFFRCLMDRCESPRYDCGKPGYQGIHHERAGKANSNEPPLSKEVCQRIQVRTSLTPKLL